jgi:hypothetical protein
MWAKKPDSLAKFRFESTRRNVFSTESRFRISHHSSEGCFGNTGWRRLTLQFCGSLPPFGLVSAPVPAIRFFQREAVPSVSSINDRCCFLLGCLGTGRWPTPACLWLEWGSSTAGRCLPAALSCSRVVYSDSIRKSHPKFWKEREIRMGHRHIEEVFPRALVNHL